MSTGQILTLGAIAGSTILIGLPLGRSRNPDVRLRAVLSAAATGILLFLLVEALVHGVEPVEDSLKSAVNSGGSWLDFIGLAVVALFGAALGYLGLVYYDRWTAKQRAKSMLGP